MAFNDLEEMPHDIPEEDDDWDEEEEEDDSWGNDDEEDYPLGGMIEPYDIGKERELLEAKEEELRNEAWRLAENIN